jgi:hypothetical protein
MDRVTAERLGTVEPHLRAVDPTAEVERLTELLAAAESRIAEEKAGRKRAETNANDMAVMVARVRNELSEERSARIAADETSGQLAKLIADENAKSRKLEEQLRLAWGQIPMVEQVDLEPPKFTVGEKLRRAFTK